MSVLCSHQTRSLFCLTGIVMPGATFHFRLLFPFLGTLPICQLCYLSLLLLLLAWG